MIHRETAGDLDAAALAIAVVERETGVPKETLRVWERRYGFPKPHRNQHGERAYTSTDVEKLRAVQRLVQRGFRPSRVIDLPLEALHRLVASTVDARPALPEHLQPLMAFVREHRADDLRVAYTQRIARSGLHDFVIGTVAPLCEHIGLAWARGEIQIAGEHLCTEVTQSVLRMAIWSANIDRTTRPRILMTTLPGEQHALGLLMAEALFSLEGAHTVSLGTQTPLHDIADAARAQAVDIVALSVSTSFPAATAEQDLFALRTELPRKIQLWIGGRNPVASRLVGADIGVIDDLSRIHAAVATWRATHVVPPASR